MTEVDEDGFARLSTDCLPERDCIEAGRAFFGSPYVGLDLHPHDDEPFRSEVKLCPLPEIAVGTVDIRGGRFERSRSRVASDSKVDFALAIVTRGGSVAAQCGRELVVSPGEAVLTTDAEWASVDFPRDMQFLILNPSRKALSALVPDPDDRVVRPLGGNKEPLRLLTAYARMIQNGHGLANTTMRHLIATHLLDLVALTISASRDTTALARGRGLRAARLNAIKADLLKNLACHDLTIGLVAARHGISRRYIGKLFECEGTTFSDFVRNQRLERVRRILSDPRSGHLSISEIAFGTGFNDLSYFNRCFRGRYGASPGDIRNASRLP